MLHLFYLHCCCYYYYYYYLLFVDIRSVFVGDVLFICCFYLLYCLLFSPTRTSWRLPEKNIYPGLCSAIALSAHCRGKATSHLSLFGMLIGGWEPMRQRKEERWAAQKTWSQKDRQVSCGKFENCSIRPLYSLRFISPHPWWLFCSLSSGVANIHDLSPLSFTQTTSSEEWFRQASLLTMSFLKNKQNFPWLMPRYWTVTTFLHPEWRLVFSPKIIAHLPAAAVLFTPERAQQCMFVSLTKYEKPFLRLETYSLFCCAGALFDPTFAAYFALCRVLRKEAYGMALHYREVYNYLPMWSKVPFSWRRHTGTPCISPVCNFFFFWTLKLKIWSYFWVVREKV